MIAGSTQAEPRPERPNPLSVVAEYIPVELKQRNQWVTWKSEFSDEKNKWTKPRIKPTVWPLHRAPPRRPGGNSRMRSRLIKKAWWTAWALWFRKRTISSESTLITAWI